jgi:hypothetical protein
MKRAFGCLDQDFSYSTPNWEVYGEIGPVLPSFSENLLCETLIQKDNQVMSENS